MFPSTQVMAQEVSYVTIQGGVKFIDWYDEKGDLNQIDVVTFHQLVADHRRQMVEGFVLQHPVMANMLGDIPYHLAVDLVRETIGVEPSAAAAIVRAVQ